MASPWSKLSRRQSNARAKKLAADPGNRSKIPTSRLKGFEGADELRAQRAMNARLNAPLVPGSDITNRQAAQDREAAVNLQYGDQGRQLDRVQADTEYHRDTRIPSWYADYQAQLQQGQQQMEAANAQAQQQILALGQGGQQLGAQMSNLPAAGADAAARGATLDPAAADRAQGASRVRDMLNSSFGGMLATQGANRVGQSIDTRTRIVPGAKIQAQAAQQTRLGQIGEDRTALAKAKADFRTKYGANQRNEASQRVAEAAVLGLKTATAEAAAADKAGEINQYGYSDADWRAKTPAQRRKIIAASKPASTTEHYGIGQDAWSKMTRAEKLAAKKEWESTNDKPGSKKANEPDKEPASSLGPRRQINTRATTFLPEYAKDNGFKLDKASRPALVAKLRQTHPGMFQGANQKFLSASLDLAIDGKVSSANLKWLRDNGVYITSAGQYWGSANT